MSGVQGFVRLSSVQRALSSSGVLWWALRRESLKCYRSMLLKLSVIWWLRGLKNSPRHACRLSNVQSCWSWHFLFQLWGVYEQSPVSCERLGITGEIGSVGLVGLRNPRVRPCTCLSSLVSLSLETPQKMLSLAHLILSGTQLLRTGKNNDLTHMPALVSYNRS